MQACLSPNGLMRYEGEAAPTRLFVATTQGISTLERDAPGKAWRVAATSLAGKHVCTMTTVPGQGGLVAGTHGDGVFWSADGVTWESRNHGLTRLDVYSVAAFARPDGMTIYAGTQPAALYKSTDLGKSWHEMASLREVPDTEAWTFPAPPHIAHTKMVTVDPRNVDTMFAAIEQGALLKTTDGGRSWRELASYSRADDRAYRDIHQVMLVPSHPDRMFMTTGVGLYRSEDAGESWERLTGPQFRLAYPDHMMLSPDEGTLFMSGAKEDPGRWRHSRDAGAAVVASRDGGRSWDIISRGVPATQAASIEAMSIVGYPGGFSLFVGNTDGEVYGSDDRGESWSRIASTLAPVSKGDHAMALRGIRGGAAAAATAARP